ncbi:S-formylglutathione hydrolase [Pseudomonas fluorescens NCIMB 11764]|uniref:S-formylglutathione hydrolase n=1 Tax=Pseudomonas fluorescens NCIMB 11764 TaxID=1221522 RepID=A0A0K1QWE6_PSEFL|nr:S-formylglutathione hydrolase [Pseudomonas fluorescens]AKV10038.1 S-formylglutathione hydrolase [Pseudomonas fluorescens NCIMB 11764]
MTITEISSQRSFNGFYKRFKHPSTSLNCEMTFGVYLPPNINFKKGAPVLYWLSGLTCTDENFMQKAGAHRLASELGIMIVAPDTSPRGEHVPDDPSKNWDFGLGAGFYIDSTQEPWSENYQMHEYVVNELPALIEENFFVSDKRGISGHSMGGHGALICAFRNPERYHSVSAFSPITNPIESAWGQKAFGLMLGDNRAAWAEWDACSLISKVSHKLPLLVDQGASDEFIHTQLMPGKLSSAAAQADYEINIRIHYGYDHSYYFVASFIEDHFRHHAKALIDEQG